MKKVVSLRFLIRFLSISILIFVFVHGWIYPDGRSWLDLVAVSFYSACCCLLFCPSHREKPGLALIYSLIMAFFLALGESVPIIRELLFSCLAPLMIFLFLGRRNWERFGPNGSIFSKDSLSESLEIEARMFYVALVYALYGTWAGLLLPIVWVLLYLRAYYGKTLYLPHLLEEKRFITIEPVYPLNPVTREDEKMTALYERIKKLMASRKPYLVPGLSLDDYSRELFTNRAYLSRTINEKGGTNFRNFINRYRINHAIELIEQKPWVRVAELAEQCGFGTIATFEAAFKLFVGQTPQEYIDSNYIFKGSRPSSSQAERQQEKVQFSSQDE